MFSIDFDVQHHYRITPDYSLGYTSHNANSARIELSKVLYSLITS